MLSKLLAPTSERASRATSAKLNRRIARTTEANVERYAARSKQIDQRLRELSAEWDVGRAIEVEAAGTILTGIALGARVHRRLLALPLFASSMLLLHNIRGWYPFLPLFRRMGLRTQREIGAERYALKAMRGDFARLRHTEDRLERARLAVEAAQPVDLESVGSAAPRPALTGRSRRLWGLLPDTLIKAQRRTRPRVNVEIRNRIERNVVRYAHATPEQIDGRLQELDREWDMERTLMTNFALVNAVGVALGARRNRRWYLLSAGAAASMVQHSLQGWCPPLPAFRRAGVRTMAEIEQERFALKALRGDFDEVGDVQAAPERTQDALRAARA